VRFPFAVAEVSLGALWIALAIWMGTVASRAPADRLRPLALTLFVAAAASLAIFHAETARAFVAYAHNLVAPLVWFFLFLRRRRESTRHRRERQARARSAVRTALVPLVLIAGGAAFFATGLTSRWLPIGGPWVSTLLAESRSFVPRSAPNAAVALALSYVFLQAVHYSIWLVWIPQETTRNGAPLTFRMSVHAARRDFSGWGLAAIVLAAIGVAIASVFRVHATRHLYLSIATFHAYLELACTAFVWTRGADDASGDGVLQGRLLASAPSTRKARAAEYAT
jgi:hypothetical protein